MKEINIRAYLKEAEKDYGEIIIDTDAVSTNLFQSLEFIGIFEFIKREYGNKFASILTMKILYSEKGLGIKFKAFRNKFSFSIGDACEKLIEDERKRIKLKLEKKN